MNRVGINIRNWAITTWVALLGTLAVYGQTRQSIQTYLQVADEYWQYEQYAEAGRYYQKVAQLEPDHLYAAYQLAECNRNLFRYVSAESGYGKVYYADPKKFPKALFYYALMQKLNGKYAYAIQNFEKFQNELKTVDAKQWPDQQAWAARTTIEIDGCQFALLREKFAQRDFGFSLIPKPVSTAANDYAPIILSSDTSLLITSGRMLDSNRVADTRLGESFSDFYGLQKSNSSWENTPGNTLLTLINTKWNEGTGCFNRDKTKFYYTNCSEPDASCKLYVIAYRGGKWNKPVRLNRNINMPGADSRQPALSVTGDTLFFVSNRRGGVGKNDIWMSVTAGEENWSPPINLGNKINTPLNELSPFIDAEGKFTFASEGHLGFGGLDIFVVNGILSQQFEVTNLGPPFNSNRDDCFLVMGLGRGYMASNRAGGVGNFDIYTFQAFSRQTVIARVKGQKNEEKPDFYYLHDFNLEYLSDKDKLSLDRVASKKEAGKVYKQEVPLTEEDLGFYRQLSKEEKDRLERLVTFNIDRKGGEEAIRAEDHAYYQQLSPEEKARIYRFASAYRKAMLNKQQLDLPKEDKFYYEKLNSEGKRTLDRVVAARFSEMETTGDSSLLVTETYYFEKLPVAIQRITPGDSTMRIRTSGYHVKEEERLIQTRGTIGEREVDWLAQPSTTYGRDGLDSTVMAKDTFFYEKLSEAEKDRLSRMMAARKAARLAGTDEKFSDEDQFYFTSLSSEDRDRLDRIMNSRLAQESPGADLSAMEDEEYNYQKIPGADRERLEHGLKNRKSRNLPTSDPLWQDESSPLQSLADAGTFRVGEYRSFTLKGRLYHAKTKLPAAGLTIPLVNEKGEYIKSTVTNPDGSFTYRNVPTKENYRVLIQTPASKIMGDEEYYVDGLEMISYSEEATDLQFEPVLFDLNQFTLSAASIRTLEALVSYCKKQPNIQIELNAFTDYLGTDAYNLELSQRRGQSVQQYLISQGILPGDIVINARGKRTVALGSNSTNGKELDRRVEIILKGTDGSFGLATEVHIISPQTDLREIARKFEMTVAELKKINSLTSDQVEPYRPLKIKRK